LTLQERHGGDFMTCSTIALPLANAKKLVLTVNGMNAGIMIAAAPAESNFSSLPCSSK
jgi:hypothetical protein